MIEAQHQRLLYTLPEISYIEFTRLLGRHPRASFQIQPDAQWLIADIRHTAFNRVMYACFEPDQADARIEEILAQYQQRGLPQVWMIGPSSQPSDLGERLQKHGLSYLGGYPGMVARLTPPMAASSWPDGFSICQVSDEDRLKEWLSIVSIAYAHPAFVSQALFELYLSLITREESPCRLYLGFLKGTAAAASLLLSGETVAGIFSVATLPQFRRRGLGRAITLATMQQAQAMGYTLAALASTQMGINVYRGLGFVECCRLDIYSKG